MFALTEFSRRTQRVTCLLMSVLIVSSALLLGARAADSAAHPGYSVTITQIQ